MGWIADLLKEIPSAARYKAELEEMEKENASLKAEKAILESQVADLRQVMQQRDDEIQREQSSTQRLEERKEEILILLGHVQEMIESRIGAKLDMGGQLAKFHLKDLEAAGLVTHVSITGRRDPPWLITQQGRAYLVSHNLLR